MGYGRLQHVTEWLKWVTAGYSTLPSGYSGLQQVTARYRVVTVDYSRLEQVTEWLQWVTAGYSSLPSGYSGLQPVTVGYRVVTVGYSRLQQVTEWLQWVTEVTARYLVTVNTANDTQ